MAEKTIKSLLNDKRTQKQGSVQKELQKFGIPHKNLHIVQKHFRVLSPNTVSKDEVQKMNSMGE